MPRKRVAAAQAAATCINPWFIASDHRVSHHGHSTGGLGGPPGPAWRRACGPLRRSAGPMHRAVTWERSAPGQARAKPSHRAGAGEQSRRHRGWASARTALRSRPCGRWRSHKRPRPAGAAHRSSRGKRTGHGPLSTRSRGHRSPAPPCAGPWRRRRIPRGRNRPAGQSGTGPAAVRFPTAARRLPRQSPGVQAQRVQQACRRSYRTPVALVRASHVESIQRPGSWKSSPDPAGWPAAGPTWAPRFLQPQGQGRAARSRGPGDQHALALQGQPVEPMRTGRASDAHPAHQERRRGERTSRFRATWATVSRVAERTALLGQGPVFHQGGRACPGLMPAASRPWRDAAPGCPPPMRNTRVPLKRAPERRKSSSSWPVRPVCGR